MSTETPGKHPIGTGTYLGWLIGAPWVTTRVPGHTWHVAREAARAALGAIDADAVGVFLMSNRWEPERVPGRAEGAILKVCRWVADRRPWRLYEAEERRPYLKRVGLLGGVEDSGGAPYLHNFVTHDGDEAHHNHPWKWALSLVIAGGYTEERTTATGQVITRVLRPGSLNLLRSSTFHRVSELHGETWTLIVLGPRTGVWGFLVDGVFVTAAERLRQRGIGVAFSEAAE